MFESLAKKVTFNHNMFSLDIRQDVDVILNTASGVLALSKLRLK